MIKATLIIICLLIVVCLVHYLFPLIQVVGDSMFPTYIDGEILIGSRFYRIKKGDVIVYHSPTDGKIVIKRVDRIVKNLKGQRYYYCLGDNSDHSYDSREYGYVSSKRLVCKVFNQRRNKNNDLYNKER